MCWKSLLHQKSRLSSVGVAIVLLAILVEVITLTINELLTFRVNLDLVPNDEACRHLVYSDIKFGFYVKFHFY